MDIGVVEIDETNEELEPRKPSMTSPGSGGSGGDYPKGGGGDISGSRSSESDSTIANRSRILTGFLLLVVLMTFGGLIAAYIVIATNNVAEWRPTDLPISVWISTAIIIISSITFHFGKLAVDRNDRLNARKYFIATAMLGAIFIASQLTAWATLSARGLYMQGNPYVGFFYILTAVHAIHIIGGISALGMLLTRIVPRKNAAIGAASGRELAQTVGWYWHFMGLIWCVLFVLLGFWK